MSHIKPYLISTCVSRLANGETAAFADSPLSWPSRVSESWGVWRQLSHSGTGVSAAPEDPVEVFKLEIQDWWISCFLWQLLWCLYGPSAGHIVASLQVCILFRVHLVHTPQTLLPSGHRPQHPVWPNRCFGDLSGQLLSGLCASPHMFQSCASLQLASRS